jgi:asparagine synthase (glutamine-hydrolysing)
MPGLSIVYYPNGNREEPDHRASESLGSLKHYEWYEESILLDNRRLFLGYTGYEEYPITLIENDGYYICFEGMIYDRTRTDARMELERLSAILFEGADSTASRAAEWLWNADGDFLIFILNKRSGDICLINDALGRLPVYYHGTGDKILVSRELRFITNLIDEIRFDSKAIAQYLLLGYPLGNLTLFDDIFRMNPASVMRAGPHQPEIRIETLLRFDVEEREEKGLDPEQYAGILAESLCSSCKQRADTLASDDILVALSGGLDSRAVAACLKKTEVPFTGITFLDSRGTARSDVSLAREVARALDCDWRILRPGSPKGGDVLKLLKIKSGMNFLGMSFSLPICLELRALYGPGAVLFTGDGGDKLLPDIKPPATFGDLDSLATYIIDAFGILPIDTVASLMRIDRNEIIGGLTESLESYVERNLKMKCVHFLIFERNYKWLFEGEDRNRYLIWVTSPFYSLDFFTSALRCPDEYKKRYRLYRDVLRILSPEVTSIDYAKWMVPIDSRRVDFYCCMRKLFLSLPGAVRRPIGKIYRKDTGGYSSDSAIMNCLRGQLKHCSAISDYLSTESVRKNLHRCSKTEIDNLFTITSVIEECLGERSTIEDYYDSVLMG